MKIIISHDVDHIDSTDHIFKDLILEKMFIRSFIQFFQGRLSFKTFFYRITMLFHKRMNRIEEVMKFDIENGIPSTFFFGMNNGLGMSYSQKKAIPYIKNVKENGFDVGVHGIDYQNIENMQKEHDDYKKISNTEIFGIRNHYVRYDKETFLKMDKVGYLFDTSHFNKVSSDYIGI